MRATNLLQFLLLASLLVISAAPPQQEVSRPFGCAIVQWHSIALSGVGTAHPAGLRQDGWHPSLCPPPRTRQHFNPAANRKRWLARYRRWLRRQPPLSRRQRRRRQEKVLRMLVGGTPPLPAPTSRSTTVPSPTPTPVEVGTPPAGPAPPAPPSNSPMGEAKEDPLAVLRQGRGWIEHVPEAELWALLRRVRWAHGLRCPRCGESDPAYLEVIDRHYRGGMYRYRCQVCHQAGDPGEGGTFTDLTGTLFDGCCVDIRSLWLIVEAFVHQAAAVGTADEVQVNRHTVDRYFRLFRAAIYLARPTGPMALGPEDIVEGDEVHITAGLKGRAGRQTPNRAPRRRGLKRRGRGTWTSDRVPILGLLCRGGNVIASVAKQGVRLITLRNVQTATIRPVIEGMVRKGAVYTDSYGATTSWAGPGIGTPPSITVPGSMPGARCTATQWSAPGRGCGRRSAPIGGSPRLRPEGSARRVYLPLYVAQFEFFFNRATPATGAR